MAANLHAELAITECKLHVVSLRLVYICTIHTTIWIVGNM